MFAASAVSAAEPAPIVLLGDGGVFPRDTIPRHATWLGLFCESSSCELRDIQVAVGASSEKNVLDEDEPTDVVYATGNPIALFAELPLTAGPVESWYQGTPTDSRSPSARLKSQGHWKLPGGDRSVEMNWVTLPGGYRYRHHITDGTHKQFLFATDAEGHYGGDTSMPEILWVGDLDRDGAADVLLSLPDDNCGFDQRLYLSSGAAPDAVLRKAAQLAGAWPACGC